MKRSAAPISNSTTPSSTLAVGRRPRATSRRSPRIGSRRGATRRSQRRIHPSGQYGSLAFASYFGGPAQTALRCARAGHVYFNYAITGEDRRLLMARSHSPANRLGGRGGCHRRNPAEGHDRLLVIGGSGETGRCDCARERGCVWVVAAKPTPPISPRKTALRRRAARCVAGAGAVRSRWKRRSCGFSAAARQRATGGLAWIAGRRYLWRHDGIGEPAGRLRGVPRRDPATASWRNSIRRPPRTRVVRTWAAGTDEIATLESRDGDLFLGGATDSVDPVLPGLAPGEGGGGGLDGLFHLVQRLRRTDACVRVGGAADDRVLGVEPGNSEGDALGIQPSVEWMQTLDPFIRPGGGRRVQRHGAFQRRAG